MPTRTIRPEFKEYYWRELLPEYKEAWHPLVWKMLHSVDRRLGDKNAALHRGIRSILVKNFQTRDATRASRASLARLFHTPEFNVREYLDGYRSSPAGVFSMSQYSSSGPRNGIVRIENTVLGHIYAAFLLGAHMNGIDVYHAISNGDIDLDAPVRLDRTMMYKWGHGPDVMSLDFTKLPDGSDYTSSCAL